MKLSTQKTVAKAVGGVAVAGALVYGLSAVFSGDDAAQVATRPQVERPQVQTQPRMETQIPRTAPVEQPVRRGDTPEEKAQKIADLQRVDADYLARNGFTVRSYLNYGTCAEGGGLENTSWRGIASGMSYSVDRDGATYQACVSHRGGKAVALTSNYSAAVAAPAPRAEQPSVHAPVANAQDVPFNKGTSDAQRDQKLADMRALDGALLAGKGMTLVRRLNVGEACDADGTISGETKWKGTASSIQYETRLDGQALQVCINHKGGKPTGQVTGSALRP